MTNYQLLRSQKIAIYVHWPFCLSKCPYCDFNSHVASQVDYDLWLSSYLAELNFFDSTLRNKYICSIFFGGGTPSLMPARIVEGVINKIASLAQVDNNTEISLEANPSSVESKKFAEFCSVGINRISLGIQSFDPLALKILGRQHSVTEAIKAIEIAKTYFSNTSFDLIYALPKQDLKAWQEELDEAILFAGNHLSLYQLTIEEGTKFHYLYNSGQLILPQNELAIDMYKYTNKTLKEIGYHHYEISNYAKSGYECKHNLNYWNYGNYLGIGPGAHSRFSFEENNNKVVRALKMHSRPARWLQEVTSQGNGVQELSILNAMEIVTEILFMGLRLKEGFDTRIMQDVLQQDFSKIIPNKKLQFLADLGIISYTDNILKLTDKGLLLHTRVVKELINIVSF